LPLFKQEQLLLYPLLLSYIPIAIDGLLFVDIGEALRVLFRRVALATEVLFEPLAS